MYTIYMYIYNIITYDMFPKNVLKLRPLTELWYKSFHSSTSWWERAPPICQAYSSFSNIKLESILSKCSRCGTCEPGRPAQRKYHIWHGTHSLLYLRIFDLMQIHMPELVDRNYMLSSKIQWILLLGLKTTKPIVYNAHNIL